MRHTYALVFVPLLTIAAPVSAEHICLDAEAKPVYFQMPDLTRYCQMKTDTFVDVRVTMSFHVNEQGRPVNPELVRVEGEPQSLQICLAEAAFAVVRTSRYELKGVPCKKTVPVTIRNGKKS